MLYVDPVTVRRLAPLSQLVSALETALRSDYVIPPRQIVELPNRDDGGLFVSMPGFDSTGSGAVKLATVCPGNPRSGLPAVQAVVVVFSDVGTPVAAIDGVSLTYLRTGAVSALAAQYLSRESSTHLVIIGTGGLAPTLAAAHCAVRPITQVTVCGRRAERAEATARAIRAMVDRRIDITSGIDVEVAVRYADIVSCATSSATPVFRGKSLKAGAHVDLVGSFSVGKREADDDAVKGARIFVDNLQGALAEAGDIVDPLRRGVIGREHIQGELADLVRGRVSGRTNDSQITLFKSVGSAMQDLAAAKLVMSKVGAAPPT
jgi:alanine dehydrogenase